MDFLDFMFFAKQVHGGLVFRTVVAMIASATAVTLLLMKPLGTRAGLDRVCARRPAPAR